MPLHASGSEKWYDRVMLSEAVLGRTTSMYVSDKQHIVVPVLLIHVVYIVNEPVTVDYSCP